MSHRDDGAPVRIDRRLAEDLARLMGALSTPSRLLILGELRESPRCVADLAAAVGMEQSAVSQQLRILRTLGFVVGTREGRRVVYALHDLHVGTLLDEAAGHLEHRRLGMSAAAPPAGAAGRA